MGKIDNVVIIPTSLENNFFRYWLEFLKPIHKLTNKEIAVGSSFLKYRYEFSKVITDLPLLEKITLNEDTKRKVREDCGISQAYFQFIMTKLKKVKFIEDNKINPKYIPRIKEESGSFQLLLSFKL